MKPLIIPLDSKCVVCDTPMKDTRYKQEGVIAMIGPKGVITCCMKHTYRELSEYENAVEAMKKAGA